MNPKPEQWPAVADIHSMVTETSHVSHIPYFMAVKIIGKQDNSATKPKSSGSL